MEDVKPTEPIYGFKLYDSDPNACYSIRLVTTVRGYYSASVFRCRRVKAVGSLRTDEHGSVFWFCDTTTASGRVSEMVVKPWRPGVDYSFIKAVLVQGKPNLVQTFGLTTLAHGPIESGLCMRFYSMNLWEFCSQRITPPALSIVLRAGCDLLRAVKSLHEIRTHQMKGLIHCTIRPQHFLRDQSGAFYLTGFEEMRAVNTEQAVLVEHILQSTATCYPASCPPEVLARIVDNRLGDGLYACDDTGNQAFHDHNAMMELACQPVTQAHDLFGLGFCVLYLLWAPSPVPRDLFYDSYNNLLCHFPTPWKPGRNYTLRELRTITDAISKRSSVPNDPDSDLPSAIKEVILRLLSPNTQVRPPAAIALDTFSRVTQEVEAQEQPFRSQAFETQCAAAEPKTDSEGCRLAEASEQFVLKPLLAVDNVSASVQPDAITSEPSSPSNQIMTDSKPEPSPKRLATSKGAVQAGTKRKQSSSSKTSGKTSTKARSLTLRITRSQPASSETKVAGED